MSSTGDIQSVVGLVTGVAVVVERLLEVFWIVVKFVLIRGLSFDFKDFENRFHRQYVRYKKFKEVVSLVIGVFLGVGLAHWLINQGSWDNHFALMEGAIGGFLSPHAHKLVTILVSQSDILSATASDTKKTEQMKRDIEEAINEASKLDNQDESAACCFLWPAQKKWWKSEELWIAGASSKTKDNKIKQSLGSYQSVDTEQPHHDV